MATRPTDNPSTSRPQRELAALDLDGELADALRSIEVLTDAVAALVANPHLSKTEREAVLGLRPSIKATREALASIATNHGVEVKS